MTTSANDDSNVWIRSCPPEDCTVDPVEGDVTEGSIPEWLSGVLYRTGSGYYLQGVKHIFDGMAILHAIEMKDGKAW